MLERSKAELERSYRDLRRSLYDDARHDVSLRAQWVTTHENNTVAVLEAASQLWQLLSHLPPSNFGTSSARTGDKPSIVPEDQ
jgi:cell wall assembly regulator SMI1